MTRKFSLALALVFLATPLAAEKKQTKWPDCYCTDRGGARIELGRVICMNVDGREYLARCEMSQNNPMWREIGGSCPVS